ncbi:hypothetical protein [Longispora fulva]|uniref:Uncharacterized protein n=1 Tax=Longispora fulva TaxID=619741 RepID=A0A8J7GXY2_9ACTN|nr:hypothetical protein [Longispora fulva]MBG6140116.1 hypothetical protein [Longispora fulva]
MRFRSEARMLGQETTLSVRQLQRWMSGRTGNARPGARRVAASLWKQPFASLVGPPVPVSPTGPVPPRTAVHEAAGESAAHAGRTWARVDDWSIEHLRAEVRRLAYGYVEIPPLYFLEEARRARDSAYTLLERTHRPAQLSDLYLVAGQLCGLMSSASFDMAAWDPAVAQVRAACSYADLIDHPALRSWARGNLALMAYWTGGPDQVVVPIDAALARSPVGTAAAGLRCVEARAWAFPDAADRAPLAIAEAEPLLRLRQALGGARWLHDRRATELRDRVLAFHRGLPEPW